MSEGIFKCVKISTIVLYSLSLVVYIVVLAITAIALAALNHTKPSADTTQEDLDGAKFLVTALIIYLVIAVVITIIGLLGAVKEHLCTLIVLCVMGVLKLSFQIWMYSLLSIFLELIFLLFTGTYAYLLIKSNKDCASGRAV